MKYLALLILIVGCSEETKQPSISLHSCESISKMLDGSFAYRQDSREPCIVYIEGGSYYFYSDGQASGISLGLAMAVNRSKLKDFNKCVGPRNENLTTEQALIIDRNCRKKLGMVNLH